MKKTILILLAVSLTAGIFAQGRGRGPRNCQPKNADIKTEIKGELVKQQKAFYDVLNKKDKARIDELKSEMTELKTEMKKQNAVEENRELHDKMYKIKKEAQKIADKYPEQSKKYTSEIGEFRKQCRENFPKQGKAYGKGGGKGAKATNNFPARMEFVNDPAFILLFDAERDNMGFRARDGRRGHAGRGGKGMRAGMRNQTNCKPGHAGGPGFGRGQNLPDDLKAELKTYSDKNIWPVLSEKRKAFEKNLSQTEKSDITAAREMMKTRNAMREQWQNSEDFVPGKRRNDTTFDAFREQMQGNMMKIKDIAGMHYAQLKEVDESLTDNKAQWKADIKQIFEKYEIDRPSGNFGRKGGFNMNNRSWVAFLLLDTEKPGENLFMFNR